MKKFKISSFLFNILLLFSMATELFHLLNTDLILKILNQPHIYPNKVLSVYYLLYSIFALTILFSRHKKTGIILIGLSIFADIFIHQYTKTILIIDATICLTLLLSIAWNRFYNCYRCVNCKTE